MAVVSVDVVAKACNLEVRRIHQLAKEGIIPRDARGEYELGACMSAYIRYLQQVIEKRTTPAASESATALRDQKRRLVQLQADEKEHEVKLLRRQVIRVEDSTRELERILFRLRSGITGMPGKYAPRLTGIETVPEAQARLEQVSDDLMLDLQRSAAEDDADDEDGSETPIADVA